MLYQEYQLTLVFFISPSFLSRKIPFYYWIIIIIIGIAFIVDHVFESHPLMIIEPDEEDKDDMSLCRFYNRRMNKK